MLIRKKAGSTYEVVFNQAEKLLTAILYFILLAALVNSILR